MIDVARGTSAEITVRELARYIRGEMTKSICVITIVGGPTRYSRAPLSRHNPITCAHVYRTADALLQSDVINPLYNLIVVRSQKRVGRVQRSTPTLGTSRQVSEAVRIAPRGAASLRIACRKNCSTTIKHCKLFITPPKKVNGRRS